MKDTTDTESVADQLLPASHSKRAQKALADEKDSPASSLSSVSTRPSIYGSTAPRSPAPMRDLQAVLQDNALLSASLRNSFDPASPAAGVGMPLATPHGRPGEHFFTPFTNALATGGVSSSQTRDRFYTPASMLPLTGSASKLAAPASCMPTAGVIARGREAFASTCASPVDVDATDAAEQGAADDESPAQGSPQLSCGSSLSPPAAEEDVVSIDEDAGSNNTADEGTAEGSAVLPSAAQSSALLPEEEGGMDAGASDDECQLCGESVRPDYEQQDAAAAQEEAGAGEEEQVVEQSVVNGSGANGGDVQGSCEVTDGSAHDSATVPQPSASPMEAPHVSYSTYEQVVEQQDEESGGVDVEGVTLSVEPTTTHCLTPAPQLATTTEAFAPAAAGDSSEASTPANLAAGEGRSVASTECQEGQSEAAAADPGSPTAGGEGFCFDAFKPAEAHTFTPVAVSGTGAGGATPYLLKRMPPAADMHEMGALCFGSPVPAAGAGAAEPSDLATTSLTAGQGGADECQPVTTGAAASTPPSTAKSQLGGTLQVIYRYPARNSPMTLTTPVSPRLSTRDRGARRNSSSIAPPPPPPVASALTAPASSRPAHPSSGHNWGGRPGAAATARPASTYKAPPSRVVAGAGATSREASDSPSKAAVAASSNTTTVAGLPHTKRAPASSRLSVGSKPAQQQASGGSELAPLVPAPTGAAKVTSNQVSVNGKHRLARAAADAAAQTTAIAGVTGGQVASPARRAEGKVGGVRPAAVKAVSTQPASSAGGQAVPQKDTGSAGGATSSHTSVPAQAKAAATPRPAARAAAAAAAAGQVTRSTDATRKSPPGKTATISTAPAATSPASVSKAAAGTRPGRPAPATDSTASAHKGQGLLPSEAGSLRASSPGDPVPAVDAAKKAAATASASPAKKPASGAAPPAGKQPAAHSKPPQAAADEPKAVRAVKQQQPAVPLSHRGVHTSASTAQPHQASQRPATARPAAGGVHVATHRAAAAQAKVGGAAAPPQPSPQHQVQAKPDTPQAGGPAKVRPGVKHDASKAPGLQEAPRQATPTGGAGRPANKAAAVAPAPAADAKSEGGGVVRTARQPPVAAPKQQVPRPPQPAKPEALKPAVPRPAPAAAPSNNIKPRVATAATVQPKATAAPTAERASAGGSEPPSGRAGPPPPQQQQQGPGIARLMSTTAAHAERVRAVAAAKHQGPGGKDSKDTWQAPIEFVSPLSSSKERAAARERLARRMAYPAPGHKPIKGKVAGGGQEEEEQVPAAVEVKSDGPTNTGAKASPPLPAAAATAGAATTPASAVRPFTAAGTPSTQHRYAASTDSKGMGMSLTSAAKLTGSANTTATRMRTPGSATRTAPSVRRTPTAGQQPTASTAAAAAGTHSAASHAAPQQQKGNWAMFSSMFTPTASINADAAPSSDTTTPDLFGAAQVGAPAAAAGSITPLIFPGLPLGGGDAGGATPDLVLGNQGLPFASAAGAEVTPQATTPSDDCCMQPMTVAKPLPWLLNQQQQGGRGGLPAATPELLQRQQSSGLQAPNTVMSGYGGSACGLLTPAPGLSQHPLGHAGAQSSATSAGGAPASSGGTGLSSPPKCLSPDAGLTSAAPQPPPGSKGPTMLQQQYQAAGVGTLLESREAAELLRESYVPAGTDVPSWTSEMGALRISTLDSLPLTMPGKWPAP